MTKEYKAILKDMIKEYELLAKYNGGKDYLRYNALQVAEMELDTYLEAITNKEFLQMNYEITDINIHFIRVIKPDKILQDYLEWRDGK